MAEVAEVLGVSTGAAKMTVSRAVRRLADAMARLEGERPSEAEQPAMLDELIEELIVEGHAAVSHERLQELIVHLAAAHQPALPPELPGRVAHCVACVGRADAAGDLAAVAPADSWRGRFAERLGLTPFAGLSWTALARSVWLARSPSWARRCSLLAWALTGLSGFIWWRWQPARSSSSCSGATSGATAIGSGC
jgi:hypothetical protein